MTKIIKEKQPYRIIISGGGTGGHVYPAIAIADKLRELQPDIRILFVGAKGKMEMEKVPAAGYEIEGLWISGLQRKLTWSNLVFPFKVLSSMMKSKKILNKFKPGVVVGVGGYASGPMLHEAAARKIPTLIQEQNSYAGLTNKILAKKAARICVAYEHMERYFPPEKIVVTGNPVRADIENLESKRAQALKHFNLDPGRKTVLVTGGSLGARTINESVAKGLEAFRRSGLQLIWQAGRFYYDEFRERVSSAGADHVRLYEFINEMDLAYSAADLVVARAGALTISELCLAGKPAILVPSPNVAEDHQTKNANALVKAGAAVLVTDREATGQLAVEIIDLAGDETRRRQLGMNIKKLARPHAAEDIAKEVLKIAG